MIELVFVACLAAAPDTCDEKRLLYTDITPMTCMMGAQPQLAQWVGAHPNFTIRKWRCQTVMLSDRDA